MAGYGQARTDEFLTRLLAANRSAVAQRVMQHPDTHRLQLIYTQINRDRKNVPTFTNYYFRVDSTDYFNPASTVKLPLALLALEKLNNLNRPGVDKFTSVQFDSAYNGQTKHWTDPTAESGYSSIAHLIRKVLLVSENDPYNRLYEFVGQQAINRTLHAKGYVDTRITHRFVRMTPDENRHTNPVRFIDRDGKILYVQPAAYNPDPFDFRRTVKIGKGYVAQNGIVNEPFDFTERNNLPLEALQQMLQSTLFPESVPAKQRFNLTESDYRFVYQYLSQYPGETNYPKYDATKYYDSYAKFFFNDSLHHRLPDGVRVFNKVGWAYGFQSDVSYVADFKNNVEFMLTASMYVNSDGILNDDQYEYETIALPFFYQVGQTIYEYERGRKRRYKPDLSRFRVDYDVRRNDARPVVKDVDN